MTTAAGIPDRLKIAQMEPVTIDPLQNRIGASASLAMRPAGTTTKARPQRPQGGTRTRKRLSAIITVRLNLAAPAGWWEPAWRNAWLRVYSPLAGRCSSVEPSVLKFAPFCLQDHRIVTAPLPVRFRKRLMGGARQYTG
jgi:hypothetical protein